MDDARSLCVVDFDASCQHSDDHQRRHRRALTKISSPDQLPNRDYWLAPQRRDESLDFLASHGYRLGRVLIVLMTGLHYLVLVANRTEPPILPESWFMAIVAGIHFRFNYVGDCALPAVSKILIKSWIKVALLRYERRFAQRPLPLGRSD